MRICTNCGNYLPDDTRFCTKCGSPVSASPQAAGDPSAQEPAPAAYTPWAEYRQQAPRYTPDYSGNSYSSGSIFYFYGKSLAVLAEKPIRLWGLSILQLIITALITSLGSLVPIITLPITLILSLGFTGVLLDGYHGKQVRSEQLFQGFKKDEVVRNGAGMCWMMLWQMIWAPVPIMNIVKSYSYCFVPYIMLTDKEITATEALRKSMRMTHGYKAKMFLADLLIGVCCFVVTLLLGVLGRIRYIGILFLIILFLFFLALILFLPIFRGLVRTAFFDHVSETYEE